MKKQLISLFLLGLISTSAMADGRISCSDKTHDLDIKEYITTDVNKISIALIGDDRIYSSLDVNDVATCKSSQIKMGYITKPIANTKKIFTRDVEPRPALVAWMCFCKYNPNVLDECVLDKTYMCKQGSLYVIDHKNELKRY